MDVRRMSDERVLLDKQYAKGNQKSSCELTVTDKRVIHSFTYKKGTETTEFRVDDIQGCSLKTKRGSPLGAFLLFVGFLYAAYGIFIALSGLFFSETAGPPSWVGALLIVLAGVLIFVGIILSRKVIYWIFVYADAMENPMLRCNALKGKSKRIRLKVNVASAREIINDLQNAVAEAKENG